MPKQMKMKILMLIIVIFMSGCGEEPQYFEPGIFAVSGEEIRLLDLLRPEVATQFERALLISGISGSLSDLRVEFTNTPFDCIYYVDQCYGEFKTTNLIILTFAPGWREAACHEFVHYLLWLKNGNADAGHVSKFFEDCKIEGAA